MTTWLSAQVWYHDMDRQDALILACVRPIVDELVRRRAVEQYYFSRSLEGGPHIRLNILPASDGAELCERVMDHRIGSYVRERPSQPPDGVTKWGVAGIEQEPDNSWRFVVYKSNVRNYANSTGWTLAERHFGDSTDVALSVLERCRGSEARVSAKMAYALQLTSILPLAAGFRGEVTYRFFEEMLGRASLELAKEDGYPEIFRRLAGHLIGRFRKLEALELDWMLSEDPVVAKWGSSCTTVLRSLWACLDDGDAKPKPFSGIMTGRATYGRIVTQLVDELLSRLGFFGNQAERILRLSRDSWLWLTLSPGLDDNMQWLERD